MGADALSDSRVVEASGKVVPILVDCTQQGAHATLQETYQIRGYPTLLFVGPGGEPLGRPPRRDAASLIQLMDQLGQQHRGVAASSSWPALVALIAVVILVPCVLIFVYKKWLAGEPAE